MTAEGTIERSVIVPVYGNRDSIGAVIERLQALDDGRSRVEAVFVVDGSPDDSLDVLRRELASGRLRAHIVSLSRNFGSFSAIRAGLRVACGDNCAVMAADLQEPPEVVVSIFEALESGDYDIALGERIGRADPALSALASRLYWSMYRRFVCHDMPPGGIDVFGCTKPIARQIAAFPETHTSLIGLLFWLGYRRTFVPYARAPRHSGTSAWTIGRKVRYLFDSVYAFTDLPIVLLQLIGMVGVVASILLGLIVLIGWIVGAVTQPGYTPLMITILASTSALLLGLGVVGSYVWRAYENGKGRPTELVALHERYGGDASRGDGEPMATEPAAQVRR